jgi:hypothetical protein
MARGVAVGMSFLPLAAWPGLLQPLSTPKLILLVATVVVLVPFAWLAHRCRRVLTCGVGIQVAAGTFFRVQAGHCRGAKCRAPRSNAAIPYTILRVSNVRVALSSYRRGRPV